MPYIIAEPCINVKDKACVEVCPVDCIYEGPEMLYIHPDECIDCGACEPVCPVKAIFVEDETPEQWKHFIELNRQFFLDNPGFSPAPHGTDIAILGRPVEGKNGRKSTRTERRRGRCPNSSKVATTDELADQPANLVELEGQKIANCLVPGGWGLLCPERYLHTSRGAVVRRGGGGNGGDLPLARGRKRCCRRWRRGGSETR
jgi:NAD-dependent dihydropyrimidine dehydrogenase PreA subunit